MAQKIDPILLIALGIGGYFWFTRTTTTGRAVSIPSQLPRVTPTARMEPSSTGDYNRWLQTSLNKLMGCGLAVDGIVGPLTKACLIRFQEMWGLVDRGTVGKETDYYLRSALGLPGYIEEPYTY